MTQYTPRARSMAEFKSLMARLRPPADAPPPPGLVARQDDVIIAPYGKCGTTMLQQMFHQLRTGGDMDFDDISRVVPWIETAPALGIDCNAPQRATPRGFKSHLAYDALRVEIRMSITAPGCGMGDVLKADAYRKVREVVGVTDVDIEIVWEPAWDQSRMSEGVQLQLGLL